MMYSQEVLGVYARFETLHHFHSLHSFNLHSYSKLGWLPFQHQAQFGTLCSKKHLQNLCRWGVTAEIIQ